MDVENMAIMSLAVFVLVIGIIIWGLIAVSLHSKSVELWGKSSHLDWPPFLFFPIRAVRGKVGNPKHRLFEIEASLRDAMIFAWPVFIVWNAVFVILLLPIRLWQVTRK